MSASDSTTVVNLLYTGPDSPKGKVYVAAFDGEGNGVVAWGAAPEPVQFKVESADKVVRKIAEKEAKGYVEVDRRTVAVTLAGDAFARYEQVKGAGEYQAKVVTVDEHEAALEAAILGATKPAPRRRLAGQLATDIDQLPQHSPESLIADPAYVAERKYDGHRVLVAVEDSKVTAYNRNGTSYGHAFGPARSLASRVDVPFVVLDGEHVNGTFHVFDIVDLPGIVHENTPYAERREALEGLFVNWLDDDVKLVSVARSAEQKAALREDVRTAGGEGIVFKHVNSTYTPGARVAEWVKDKFVSEADVIVVAIGEKGHNSATVAVIDPDAPDDKALVLVGKASLNGKERWGIKLGDVVTVRYLSCDPVERRLVQCRLAARPRSDKAQHECTIDQLRFTRKELSVG